MVDVAKYVADDSIEVQAVRFNGHNFDEVYELCDDGFKVKLLRPSLFNWRKNDVVRITNYFGRQFIPIGSWVVRARYGYYFGMEHFLFDRMYKPVVAEDLNPFVEVDKVMRLNYHVVFEDVMRLSIGKDVKIGYVSFRDAGLVSYSALYALLEKLMGTDAKWYFSSTSLMVEAPDGNYHTVKHLVDKILLSYDSDLEVEWTKKIGRVK